MCVINRDDSGQITSVNSFSGEPSILFDKIASNPHIGSMEDAVNIYKNVYSEKFIKKSGDWQQTTGPNQYETQEPRLFYKDAFGKITESFGEALNNSDGGSIEMGFVTTDDIVETSNGDNFFNNDLVVTGTGFILNDEDAFTTVVTISNTNSNPETRSGFINHGIKTGVLSDTMKKVGNQYFLKGAGNQNSLSEFNSQIVRARAIKHMGTDSVIAYSDGTLEIFEPNTDVELISENGETRIPLKEMQERLENKEFSTLEKKYDGMLSVAYNIYRKTHDLFSKAKTNLENRTDKDLKVVLLNSLSKLGISTLSISEYVTKYRQKNGADPDVNALADIANQVIAFAEGQDSVENLSEETAHFIIEGYHNQQAINEILPQVEQTPEWSQYSELYKNKYGQYYSGEKLTEVVRREVLGKILAKAILNRNSQSQQTGIVASVLNLWDSFVARVRGFFFKDTKRDIDSVVEFLASQTVNEEIESYIDVNLLKASEFTLYSLEDRQTLLALIKGKERLEAQLKALKSSKDATSVNVTNQINNINEAIKDRDEWLGVKTLLAALEPQVKTITRQLEDYKALSKDQNNADVAYFTPEEQHAFRTLADDFLPLISELKAIIKDDTNAPDKIDVNKTVAQITSLETRINTLRGEVSVQARRDIGAIYNRIASVYGLTEAHQEKLEKLIEDEFKDVGMLQGFFGSLEHADNSLLGMLGRIINDNNNKAHTRLLRDIKQLRKKVDDEGWDINKFEAILERDEEGNITGFLESPYLWGEYMKAEEAAKVATYNKIFKTKLTVKQYNSGLRAGKVKRRSEYSLDERNAFTEEMAKWYDQNTEKKYTKEYYDNRDKLYNETLKISEATQEFLRNLSTSRYIILSKYMEPGVQLDYTKVSIRDREQLSQLAQRRKAAKSPVNAITGEIKDTNSVEGLLARDLEVLDKHFQDERTKDGADLKKIKVKDAFFKTLEKIEKTEGPQAAFDWLNANGGLAFSSEFWDSFAANTSLIDRLKDLQDRVKSESEEDGQKLANLTDILQELMLKKTSILRQYQVPNSPAEVDFDNMHPDAVDNIRAIETELQERFNDMNKILRDYDENEVVNPNIATENTVNEAYEKALADSGKKELDFISEHVTDNDKARIAEINININKIYKGGTFVKKSLENFVTKKYGIDGSSDSAIRELISRIGVEQLAIEYSKTRLLPYFKRFAPQGYDTFLKELKSGKRSVSEFVNKARQIENGDSVQAEAIERLVTVSTQFAWTEDQASNEFINTNYRENFEGGRRQPLTSKYLSDSFFTKYKVNKQEYLKTGNLNSKSESQELSMLKILVDLKRKGLRAYKEQDSENVYKLPQSSKGTVQKSKDFLTKSPVQTAGNAIKDLIYNRVDTLEHGARVDGQDVRDLSELRLMPKYYIRDLEQKSDLSTELLRTYVLFLHSAYNFEQRSKTVSDAMVLEQKLLDSRFAGGKSAKESQAYKMFKNFVDSHFFGIKHTKKFEINMPNGKKLDLTIMATAFDRLDRLMNIGFSVPVAATSYFSAKIFLRIENYIGEHTNDHSAKWATKEFWKLTPKFVGEAGKINRDSKLHQLGERFRVFNFSDSTVSSGYSRATRFLNNVPYKFSEIANFPIAPRIMLTILDDFRLIGGKFVDFNTYKNLPENVNMDAKERLKQWETYRSNSMYNLLETGESGIIEFNQQTRDNIDNEYLEQQLSRVQSKISRVNANVDSVVPQEDKSAATRHVLARFTTAHRGWLSIAAQRRFKRAHFNFATGQKEEGHYITVGRFFNQVYNGMKEKGVKQMMSDLKEEFHKLDDFEKRNLKRVMVEFGAYMTLLGMGMIVAGLADDDDNKDLWTLQFMAYIYFRTTNEVGSVQAPTGVFGLVETVQTPFVALNSVKQIMDVKGFSLEEVESGAYEGHTKLFRKLSKITFLKHYFGMRGVKQKSDFYRLINSETLFTMQREKKED